MAIIAVSFGVGGLVMVLVTLTHRFLFGEGWQWGEAAEARRPADGSASEREAAAEAPNVTERNHLTHQAARLNGRRPALARHLLRRI